MTTCESVRDDLSALLDNELSDERRRELISHLSGCRECNAEWESLKRLDRRLTDELVISNRDDSVSRIVAQSNTAPLIPRSLNVSWNVLVTCVATIAVVFLIVFIATRGPFETKQNATGLPKYQPQIIAQLTRATGDILVMGPNQDRWRALTHSGDTPLEKGTRLKTGDNVLCEVQTSEECKIRMNELGELVLQTPRKVELVAGQLWCRAPDNSAMDVEIKKAVLTDQPLATMTCPKSSEIQCESDSNQLTCKSLSTENEIATLQIGTFGCTVEPGEFVSVDANQNVKRIAGQNLNAKVWQLPLLAVGNTIDQELDSVLEKLLIPIGRTKALHVNEYQIRNLGPKGAIPLLAYAASDSSSSELRLRQTAVNLAHDMADQTAISLLQKLESDPDAMISRIAKKTLARIAANSD